MKQLIVLILLSFVFAQFTVFAETKEGACKLNSEERFKVQVGNKIKGTCEFYTEEFFGKKIISANICIENTTKKSMHCQYNVAFFDNAGKLIGCASQGTFDEEGLAAGKSTMLGSCLIPLPPGLHEKVVQYKIAFYESEKQIGK